MGLRMQFKGPLLDVNLWTGASMNHPYSFHARHIAVASLCTRDLGTKAVMRKDQLAAKLSPAPKSVIESIRRKFSDGGEIRKFHIDLIMTHCCAIAAVIDNFETDIQDLYQDLQADAKIVSSYYQEIGARLRKQKAEGGGGGGSRLLAKLSLPLNFPKMSKGAPKRR